MNVALSDKERWLQQVWAFLVWLGGKFMAIARFCLEKLLAENVSFNFPAAVLLVLATTILIGSGCWAASIALSRRHSGWLHFLLGALMPGIYPLVIMFAMGLKGERKRKKQRAAERRAREKEEEEKRLVMEIQGIQPQEEPVEEDEGEFNAQYFERIARDASGNKAGPWKVNFAGADIIVQEILDVQADFVLVEMTGREGTNEKMRIPYSKVESWRDYYTDN
jgi:hypothetical protein